jgi:hypothetical protein
MKKSKWNRKTIGFLSAGMIAASLSSAVAVRPVYAAGEVSDAGYGTVAGVSGEQTDVAGTQKISVTGVRAEDLGKVSVRAYQLADGYYQDGMLIRYVLTDPENAPIADLEHPTAAEISNAAAAIIAGRYQDMEKGTVTLKREGDADTFSGQAEPGLYLVLVSGGEQTEYNPAIVAVNVTDANTGEASGGTADMGTYFTEGSEKAYLKYTSYGRELGSEKKIAGSAHTEDSLAAADSPVTVGNPHGDAVAKGDTVSFSLDGITIPGYTDAWDSPVFMIDDTLDDTFGAISGLKVEIRKKADGGTGYGAYEEITSSDAITLTGGNGKKQFHIQLSPAFLKSFQHETDLRPELRITYQSKLEKTDHYNFSANLNRMTVTYSNDLTDKNSTKQVTENTYHYTFAIDGSMDPDAANDGDETTTTWQTSEFVKNGVKVITTEETDKTAVKDSDKNTTGTKESGKVNTVEKNALAGAVFTLYKDEAMKEPIASSESDGNGTFSFTGLDTGTYFMKETKAPEGYTPNTTRYRFVIGSVTYSGDGAMTSYQVDVSAKGEVDPDYQEVKSFTYHAKPVISSETGRITNTVETAVESQEPVVIRNAKLKDLPSAGGVGIFAAVAAAAAAGTAGIALSGKKKEKADKK